MNTINDIFLVVKLRGDIEEKYKIICRMDFFNTVVDVRTGRKIFIEGMYSNVDFEDLCCYNKFKIISKSEAYDIIKKDNIDEYNEYLDEIERRNNKKRVMIRKK